MTEMRKPAQRPWIGHVLLGAILLAALALRVDGVGFGLPALNDPDEPLFLATAFEMLRNGSLNPGWFGHPGTTTLYALALIMVAVGGLGLATGRFADADAFAAAVYADPGIVVMPARLFILLCGVACVWMTYRIGRRLGGMRVGLVAAAMLAVNAVHIEYSQIIRTDMQASLFMLLGTMSALAIVDEGRRRDYILAGIFTGLACATKWPAAAIGLTAIYAGIWRMRQGQGLLGDLAIFGLVALLTLFVISPYLLIDHATVLNNLSDEARPLHPGATGGGLFDNLGWYVTGPLLSSMGLGGLLLATAGTIWGVGGDRRWALVILPFCLVFLLMIAAQSLRWERWIVPLLPFATIAAARALCGAADLLPRAWGERLLLPVATLLLLTPMLATARTEATERRHDTRQIASAWLRQHAPAGRSVLIEHGGFDLLQGPWRLRFPLGSAGCVDIDDMLGGRMGYSEVEDRRRGAAIVDIGHVELARLDSCRADFVVVSNRLRYRADPAGYRDELRRYDRLLGDGVLRLTIRPEPGRSSGPEVQIYELKPPAPPPPGGDPDDRT
ncbi:MAG: oxidoreductase [Sphingopyxis sp.]|nr:oxidoreductase [Sphingopyxis sp.]